MTKPKRADHLVTVNWLGTQ